MRNVTDDDKRTLTLLKEGAEAAQTQAAAASAQSEAITQLQKVIAQQGEQIGLLRYGLMNIMKTLQTYNLMGKQLEELDYRTLGLMTALGQLAEKAVPAPNTTQEFVALVDAGARKSRVEAFDQLSADNDKEANLVDAADEPLTEEHTVIFTSEQKENDEESIFRSKILVGSKEFEGQKAAFLGKKVGDTFPVDIRGKAHTAKILGVRRKKTDAAV